MGVHWPSLTMTFAFRDNQVMLRGDPSLTKAEVSLKVMTKTWEAEDQGFLIEFQNMEIEEEEEGNSEERNREIEQLLVMIQTLLGRNQDIFELLKVLPPKREVDHKIVMAEGQPPIKVRPYKYGHAQKDEIERLV